MADVLFKIAEELAGSNFLTIAFGFGLFLIVIGILGDRIRIIFDHLTPQHRMLSFVVGFFLTMSTLAGTIFIAVYPTASGTPTAISVAAATVTDVPPATPTATETASLTRTPTLLRPTSTEIFSTTPMQIPVASETDTSSGVCGPAVELGPWPPIGGQGRDIPIDASNGWVHADFWSPTYSLRPGYDEVSVLFEPGTQITVVGVAGQGWLYNPACSREYIEQQIVAHQERRWNLERKRLITVSVDELPTR